MHDSDIAISKQVIGRYAHYVRTLIVSVAIYPDEDPMMYPQLSKELFELETFENTSKIQEPLLNRWKDIVDLPRTRDCLNTLGKQVSLILHMTQFSRMIITDYWKQDIRQTKREIQPSLPKLEPWSGFAASHVGCFASVFENLVKAVNETARPLETLEIDRQGAAMAFPLTALRFGEEGEGMLESLLSRLTTLKLVFTAWKALFASFSRSDKSYIKRLTIYAKTAKVMTKYKLGSNRKRSFAYDNLCAVLRSRA